MKLGKQTNYRFPEINEDKVVFNSSSLSIKINVWLQELNFRVKNNAGYVLKIEASKTTTKVNPA